LGPNFRHRREPKLAIQAGFRPPFTCPVQPLKAEPRSGLGRLPKASRVRACEARPRAPHPTGLGYPAPIKLSLCPTSVTPLEAPLIGQDTGRISEVLGTGIRNAKIFLRASSRSCAPDAAQRVALRGAVRCRAGAPVTCCTKKPGSRFCEAALRKGYALHRARDTPSRRRRTEDD